jgi:hypothetical protein
MPLPNGVDPWGHIQSTCPSAEFLGNRGILHDAEGVITRSWKNKAWVTCALHYGGRNRKPLMQPGRYSELFFLDEATALSAGHRPCGECRKQDYSRFKAAWFATHTSADMSNAIGVIDETLHHERISITNKKKTFKSPIHELPHGAVFEANGNAYLHWHNGPLLWSPSGYEVPGVTFSASAPVDVLTPPSIVSIIRAGYVPQIHGTAGG